MYFLTQKACFTTGHRSGLAPSHTEVCDSRNMCFKIKFESPDLEQQLKEERTSRIKCACPTQIVATIFINKCQEGSLIFRTSNVFIPLKLKNCSTEFQKSGLQNVFLFTWQEAIFTEQCPVTDQGSWTKQQKNCASLSGGKGQGRARFLHDAPAPSSNASSAFFPVTAPCSTHPVYTRFILPPTRLWLCFHCVTQTSLLNSAMSS